MPKILITHIQLPPDQPDCCYLCPLCGIIPKEERPKGSREGFVCLGTMEALTSKGIRVLASKRDAKHPLHRPCDATFASWLRFPGRKIAINTDNYLRYRVPFDQSKQTTIKFHKL